MADNNGTRTYTTMSYMSMSLIPTFALIQLRSAFGYIGKVIKRGYKSL
jgi:hypothetical protein